jgi:hypothetical protein
MATKAPKNRRGSRARQPGGKPSEGQSAGLKLAMSPVRAVPASKLHWGNVTHIADDLFEGSDMSGSDQSVPLPLPPAPFDEHVIESFIPPRLEPPPTKRPMPPPASTIQSLLENPAAWSDRPKKPAVLHSDAITSVLLEHRMGLKVLFQLYRPAGGRVGLAQWLRLCVDLGIVPMLSRPHVTSLFVWHCRGDAPTELAFGQFCECLAQSLGDMLSFSQPSASSSLESQSRFLRAALLGLSLGDPSAVAPRFHASSLPSTWPLTDECFQQRVLPSAVSASSVEGGGHPAPPHGAPTVAEIDSARRQLAFDSDSPRVHVQYRARPLVSRRPQQGSPSAAMKPLVRRQAMRHKPNGSGVGLTRVMSGMVALDVSPLPSASHAVRFEPPSLPAPPMEVLEVPKRVLTPGCGTRAHRANAAAKHSEEEHRREPRAKHPHHHTRQRQPARSSDGTPMTVAMHVERTVAPIAHSPLTKQGFVPVEDLPRSHRKSPAPIKRSRAHPKTPVSTSSKQEESPGFRPSVVQPSQRRAREARQIPVKLVGSPTAGYAAAFAKRLKEK